MLQKITTVLLAYGPWGVFLLALIDSAGVPVPSGMDVLLIVVAAKTPSQAWLAAFLAVVGSLIGNIMLYWICRRGGGSVADRLPEPGSRSHRFRAWYRRYGLITVFIPAVVPVIPLPLKVFVISAGVLRTSFGAFLGVVLIARLLRFFGLAWLGTRLGAEGARTFLVQNAWTLTCVAVALVIVCYVLIRISDRNRRAAER